jgi:N-acetylated-alpha-linked acidic dipeptidase
MAPHEQTPLIATVRVARPRNRYGTSVAGRFCKIACGATLIAVVLFALVPALFLGGRHHRHDPLPDYPHQPPPAQNPITYKELQEILLTTPKEEKAAEWSKYYTAGPHLAGKNYSQALWTKQKWNEFGIDSSIVAYNVYINYPLGHRLALYEKKASKAGGGKHFDSWEVKYEASLEEDVLEEDPTTGLENRIPTFHGYSASGNVTSQYVYVNYGSYADVSPL